MPERNLIRRAAAASTGDFYFGRNGEYYCDSDTWASIRELDIMDQPGWIARQMVGRRLR